MRLIVNGAPREARDGLTVAGLLEELGLDRNFVAVERNREVVPRAEHGSAVLRDGDVLEIVHFVGGG